MTRALALGLLLGLAGCATPLPGLQIALETLAVLVLLVDDDEAVGMADGQALVQPFEQVPEHPRVGVTVRALLPERRQMHTPRDDLDSQRGNDLEPSWAKSRRWSNAQVRPGRVTADHLVAV